MRHRLIYEMGFERFGELPNYIEIIANLHKSI
jgi:hypothetical protein